MHIIHTWLHQEMGKYLINPLPNFLIAGAAKSGTTSLYYYLYGHPEIFMSKFKEPEFFTHEMQEKYSKVIGNSLPYISKFADYLELFADVRNEKVIGEASTATIYYHSTSIPLIKKILGNPKIIIMLRNPVYACFSMYTHRIRDNRENFSFEEALKKEDERIKEGYRLSYHYKKRALYSDQVKAFLSSFSDVKVIIYEEFVKDIPATLRSVFDFLEVDSDYNPPNTSISYNASGVPRIRWINNIFTMKNPIQMGIQKIGNKILTPSVYAGLRDSIRQKNMIRAQMNPETLMYLQDFYSDNIRKLEEILDRDLSIWTS